jgi:hypothetical protein
MNARSLPTNPDNKRLSLDQPIQCSAMTASPAEARESHIKQTNVVECRDTKAVVVSGGTLKSQTARILAIWETQKPGRLEIACILYEIKTTKSYKERYDTFQEYCEEELPFGRSRAYQMIDVASSLRSLPENVQRLDILNSKILAALARVPKERRQAVLERAQDLAGAAQRILTATHVHEAIQILHLEGDIPLHEIEVEVFQRKLDEAWRKAPQGVKMWHIGRLIRKHYMRKFESYLATHARFAEALSQEFKPKRRRGETV